MARKSYKIKTKKKKSKRKESYIWVVEKKEPQETLRQLGGNKFIVMTGAKNFVKGKNYIAFKIPKSKDKINYVKITLNSKDLYDIEYGKIEGFNYKVVKTERDIYADGLQDNFTRNTGLYTHL